MPIPQGFEEIETINIIDVLRRADIKVLLATLDGNRVKGANRVNIFVPNKIEDMKCDDFDMIVLPGGPGAKLLGSDKRVQDLIKEFDQKSKAIGAICAAPVALEKAGVLKEGYTCYPSSKGAIKTAGYTDKQKIVQSGNILTSRGPGTAICFALAIVKGLMGQARHDKVKSALLVDFC
jgi:4-methyl-5(b-hydroxyethyl)-thiazole monophosphate biosynthesis